MTLFRGTNQRDYIGECQIIFAESPLKRSFFDSFTGKITPSVGQLTGEGNYMGSLCRLKRTYNYKHLAVDFVSKRWDSKGSWCRFIQKNF